MKKLYWLLANDCSRSSRMRHNRSFVWDGFAAPQLRRYPFFECVEILLIR